MCNSARLLALPAPSSSRLQFASWIENNKILRKRKAWKRDVQKQKQNIIIIKIIIYSTKRRRGNRRANCDNCVSFSVCSTFLSLRSWKGNDEKVSRRVDERLFFDIPFGNFYLWTFYLEGAKFFSQYTLVWQVPFRPDGKRPEMQEPVCLISATRYLTD
jgi:hypothetical protein